MADYDFIKMQKKLSKYLDEDRFEHTLGVMFTCASLAMVHGYDLKDAQAAGLLHDSAKCIPNKKKLKMCAEHNIPVTPFEKEHPFLLHAKLGAYIARAKYGITDEEILSSITFHTTGKPEMSTLEKIVYIADYIEPLRQECPSALRLPRKWPCSALPQGLSRSFHRTTACARSLRLRHKIPKYQISERKADARPRCRSTRCRCSTRPKVLTKRTKLL